MFISMKELGCFLAGLAAIAFAALEVHSFEASQPEQRSEIKECIPEVKEPKKVELGTDAKFHQGW
jgi:hypothetical protein